MFTRWILTAAGPLVATMSSAAAQFPDVAIVAAAANTLTDCRFTDVQAKLLATGRFNSVDVIHGAALTPTLNELAPYAAVLTWSNVNYQSGAAMGDVLADYVDGGGGVVVAVYALSSNSSIDRRLGGRWSAGGYDVIQTGLGTAGGAVTLGNVLVAGHPLMAGVSAFASAQGARPAFTTLIQGHVIAEWSDGRILVACGADPRRVDLGFYPPSSDCSSPFWDASTDGATLLANALEFVAPSAGRRWIGWSYCGPAAANTAGSEAVIQATGSTEVDDDDVTIIASQVPANQFGFFLTSQTQGLVSQPAGSQGDLCLGGTIGRYVAPGQVSNAGASGVLDLVLDLSRTPAGGMFVDILPGETWNFQAWYRDVDPLGQPSSNFTDARSITFR